jgi:hypothetical protein
MPAGVGCLTRPAWGCLGYPIFILEAVLETRSHFLSNSFQLCSGFRVRSLEFNLKPKTLNSELRTRNSELRTGNSFPSD